MPSDHGKHHDDPPGWLLCLLIALVAAGLTVALAAYFLPFPHDPTPTQESP